jgi:mannosyltransferase OCH1-like enzyme
MPIPHTIFQTFRHSLPEYVKEMILKRCPGYNYEFYDDAGIIQFMRDHPTEEFPHILDVYHRFHDGAHRADVFRYYYIFVKGGLFLDRDAMIYENIDHIVDYYDFFSVDSLSTGGHSIFQGIIGACPKNAIIKEALKNICNTPQEVVSRDYHYFCKDLYLVVHNHSISFPYRVKLYKEIRYDNSGDYIDDTETGRTVFRHYWSHKTIPRE